MNTDTNKLPDGWSKRYTPEGKPYYQNNITKSTQWECPIKQQSPGLIAIQFC